MPKSKPKSDGPSSGGTPSAALRTTEIIVPELPSEHIRHDALERFREAILERHTLAMASMVDALLRRIECGALLYEARAIVPHKQWEKWLTDNFSAETGLAIRTAQRYMQDYRLFMGYVGEHAPRDGETTPVSPQMQRELLLQYCRQFDEQDRKVRAEKDDANNWVTPKSVVEVVEAVLGSIDCDPCASISPQAAPLGTTRYTIQEDGLAADRPWTGKAWIAPGHQGDLSRWAQKAVAEFEAGRLTDAILCLPVTPLNLPSRLQECPVAISRSPLTVGYPTAEGIQARRLRVPHLFLYLSRTPNVEAFAHAFRDIAVVFGTAVTRSSSLTINSTPNKE